jgi:hypothetical protein
MQSSSAKWPVVPSKFDIWKLRSEVPEPRSGMPLCRSRSNDIQEEESASEYGPYGHHYEKITEKHLKNIALELGLIKLYWPQQLIPDVDQYVCKYISRVCFCKAQFVPFPNVDMS